MNPVDTRPCLQCGEALPLGYGFCFRCGAPAAEPPPTDDATLLTSGTLSHRIFAGRWQADQILNRGEMGWMYRGRDLQSGAPVGIKVLPPSLQVDERKLARFQREGKGLKVNQHPNVVEWLDSGKEGEVHFIAMEWVEGVDLNKFQADNPPLALDLVVLLVGKVLAGLAHLHAQGWVHRDIKAGNIMVTVDHQVKLLDLGIAKQLGGETALTRINSVVGTPQYLSPEQCIDSSDVDARADLYAVGVLLYHLITRKFPFSGRTTSEVIEQHLYQTPRRPGLLRQHLPPELDALVMKLLKKRREERCQTAVEAGQALAASLAKGQDLRQSQSQWEQTLVILGDSAGMESLSLAAAASSESQLGNATGAQGTSRSRSNSSVVTPNAKFWQQRWVLLGVVLASFGAGMGVLAVVHRTLDLRPKAQGMTTPSRALPKLEENPTLIDEQMESAAGQGTAGADFKATAERSAAAPTDDGVHLSSESSAATVRRKPKGRTGAVEEPKPEAPLPLPFVRDADPWKNP